MLLKSFIILLKHDLSFLYLLINSILYCDVIVAAQLAPLFAKKQEKIKPKMDDIAKQEFLNSSVPDAVRRKMDSLKK